MNFKPFFASAIVAIPLCFSTQVSALNIVLTNDDSWHTNNIQTLFSKLSQAGHSVLMSAPCTGQSGKGGAINFLKAVNVDRSKLAQNQVCVGDTDETLSFNEYVGGTPVMAVLYGIDVLAQEKWGQMPDLVISGPNEGNNVGYLTNISGTLGATNISIARGLPTIAISAADGDEIKATLVADVVLDIIENLMATQEKGQPLLSKFTGLNINTPEDIKNHKGYKFTNVGWNAGGYDVKFVTDMSKEALMMGYVAKGMVEKGLEKNSEKAMAMARARYAGKSGISFDNTQSLVNDQDSLSEGVLVKQGYITISTIDANIQANQTKSSLTKTKLKNLLK